MGSGQQRKGLRIQIETTRSQRDPQFLGLKLPNLSRGSYGCVSLVGPPILGGFPWAFKPTKKKERQLQPHPSHKKERTHLLSGWPKKSPNFLFTTKMVFPKSLKFMKSGSERERGEPINKYIPEQAVFHWTIVHPLRKLRQFGVGIIRIVHEPHIQRIWTIVSNSQIP